MLNYLPPLQKGLKLSKKVRYRLAVILDIILIAIILVNGRQSAQRLISPVVSSLQTYSPFNQELTKETFAFVPDLARNKFPHIDLKGLTFLSFFDVPITKEGEINYNSRGYQSFTSDEALALFDRARVHNTKVFLTLSAMDEDIIKNLLDSSEAQAKLADQVLEEVNSSNLDGIVIDFESPQHRKTYSSLAGYQRKFTDFIQKLRNTIKEVSPNTQLAVAVPSCYVDNQSLYNIEALSNSSDRIFLIATDFIVPEVKNASAQNPVFGYNEGDYKTQIANLLNNLIKKVRPNKLVMERAWYGNGDQYPLYYVPGDTPPEKSKQPVEAKLDEDHLQRLLAGVPEKGKQAARESIPLIAKALAEEGILDSNVLAYALATVEHETDETFAPIEELGGTVNARRFGYEGGANYFGRGFIQITHLRNYRQIGRRIGLGDQLVKTPELALKPEIAAKILAAFFKDNNVANLASQGLFIAARKPVNPDINGYSIASLALKYGIY